MRWHYPPFTDVATDTQSLSTLTKITQLVTKPGSKFKWSVIKFSLPCSKYFHIITPIAVSVNETCHTNECQCREKAQICFFLMLLLIGMPHKNQKFRKALSNKNKMRTTHGPLNFPVTTLKKMGGIKFNNIFYLNHHIQNTIISKCICNEVFCSIFPYYIFEIQCMFYIYSTSQFIRGTFQGLHSHMSPVATTARVQVWTVQETEIST